MPVLAGIMLPHPPLMVAEIGRGEEAIIDQTKKACINATKFLSSFEPETVIISSPHTTNYTDYFHISPGSEASGSFADFAAPQVAFKVRYDEEFVLELLALAKEQAFPATSLGEKNPALDHGTMLPLYFLGQQCKKSVKIVRIGLSGLSLADHYRFGQLIQRTAKKLNRKIAYIASGDLSHMLKAKGPYGFSKEGPEYDTRIMEVMGKADFGKLFDFSENFLNKAAECGHRSFVILAGVLDGLEIEAKELSYQSVTGVGYGVCTFKVKGKNPSRAFLNIWETLEKEKIAKARSSEDAYVLLARTTIESYIKSGKIPTLSQNLSKDLPEKRAGVFVSIHKGGQLRGCIGTISPCYASIAEEIQHNAIAASTKDPRFPAVQPDELPFLDYSLDVLSEAEAISSLSELDPQRYGVIVSSGSKRGLLLPMLEGVDTAEEQVSIARKKAGIGANEKIQLERFEVVRHT